jgi:hypothetical protein
MLASSPVCANVSVDPQPHSYQAILREKEAYYSRDTAYEIIASGAAATMIGFYGYYFDTRGHVAKVAYAATQTAGIIGIGEGIRRFYGGSLEVDLEGAMVQNGRLEPHQIRALILDREAHQRYAERVATAWTAGLLAATYLYNAHREPPQNEAARSIYLFLAANAMAVSVVSGYAATDHRPIAEKIQAKIGLGTITFVYNMDP